MKLKWLITTARSRLERLVRALGKTKKRKFTVMGTIKYENEWAILIMPTCGTFEAENADEAAAMFQDDQPIARSTCVISYEP